MKDRKFISSSAHASIDPIVPPFINLPGNKCHAATSDDPSWHRLLFVFLLFGIIGIGIVEAVRGVTGWSRKHPATTAQSHTSADKSSSPSRDDKGTVIASPRVQQLTPSPAPYVPAIKRTDKFAVMIPFDTAQPNSFTIPRDENLNDPLFHTYAEMNTLACNGAVSEADRKNSPATGQITYQLRPISMNESSQFLGKLLQYFIFQSIDRLQRNSLMIGLGVNAAASAGIEPPDAEPYPSAKLFKELSDNVFFRPFLHRPSSDEMSWKVKPVRMPKGTNITFGQLSQPERYLIRFQRPNYYMAEFVVEGFVGTGVGSIPKNFAAQQVATVMQWSYFVTMRYTIEHPSDEDYNPDSYARWFDALYAGLRKKLVVD
jgi:hypothetical protein